VIFPERVSGSTPTEDDEITISPLEFLYQPEYKLTVYVPGVVGAVQSAATPVPDAFAVAALQTVLLFEE
jgi:hypothetical protein